MAKREKQKDPVKGIKKKKADKIFDRVAIVFSDDITEIEKEMLEDYVHVVGIADVTKEVQCGYHVAITDEDIELYESALGGSKEVTLYCPLSKKIKGSMGYMCKIAINQENKFAAVFNCCSSIGIYRADVFGYRFLNARDQHAIKIGANVINVKFRHCDSKGKIG